MISRYVLASFLLAVCLIGRIGCPPVVPEEKPKDEHNNNNNEEKTDGEDPILTLEYHRYLKEVVNLLESDNNFKQLIEKASPEDIKTGKIASQLQFVQHHVRTKLDELKRKEIDRMRELIGRKAKLNNIKSHEIHTLLPKHLDHNNVDTFEEKDLENLIKSASADLEEYDKQRRAEFKDHELEKEYERREHLNQMDETHRKEAEEAHRKNMEARKHHEKINHPGGKQQLEEVWEEQDQMDENQFDPKTFFALHDTDGNGFLDEFEIEALFQIELNKIFNSTDPEYDPAERDEEMNRMREHVFTEMDKNRDKMVSLEEFINETKEKDFDDNEEWKSIDDEIQFDEKEFEEYSKRHSTPPPHA